MIICQQSQAINNIGGSVAASNASKFQKPLMAAVPASLGAPFRSPAATDIILSNRQRSPQSKPLSPPSHHGFASLGKVPKNKDGNEGPNHAMSGLSLALMNEEAHACLGLGDHKMMENQNGPNTQTDDEQYEQEIEECIIPGSHVTRMAFHEPPPLYPDGIHRAKLQKSPFLMPSPSSSNAANVLDGSVGGVVDPIASPALPSLIQRCSVDGSPRLKMFQQEPAVESTSRGDELNHSKKDTPSSDATIKDRLSDFRLFGVALEI